MSLLHANQDLGGPARLTEPYYVLISVSHAEFGGTSRQRLIFKNFKEVLVSEVILC